MKPRSVFHRPRLQFNMRRHQPAHISVLELFPRPGENRIMIAARRISRIDRINLAFSQRRCAPCAAIQLAVWTFLQLSVSEGSEGFSGCRITGFTGMVSLPTLGIVVEGRAVFRIRNLPPLPILPDHELHVGLAIVPDVLHIHAIGCFPALYADTAVAGLLTELRLIDRVSRGRRVRHLMEQITAVVSDRLGADHVPILKSAHGRKKHKKLSGARLVPWLLAVDKACRYQQRGI